MLLAAWVGERRVLQVALVAYLFYAVPHTIYHLANDGVLSSGSQVVNGALLLSTRDRRARIPLADPRRPPSGEPGRVRGTGGSGSRLGSPPGGALTLLRPALRAAQVRGRRPPARRFRPPPQARAWLRRARAGPRLVPPRAGAAEDARRAPRRIGRRMRVVHGLRLAPGPRPGRRHERRAPGTRPLPGQRRLLGARQAGPRLRDGDDAHPGRRSATTSSPACAPSSTTRRSWSSPARSPPRTSAPGSTTPSASSRRASRRVPPAWSRPRRRSGTARTSAMARSCRYGLNPPGRPTCHGSASASR